MKASADLKTALEAARAAGDVLRHGFLRQGRVRRKGDRSLVTEFDGAAERLIRERLSATPYSILGEEEGLTARESGRVWVVDPLDGTTNFSRRLELFVVSIALMEEDEVLVGVIYDPITDDCFFAEKGSGAFKNKAPLQIDARPSLQPVVFLECGVADDHKRRMTENVRRLALDFDVRLMGTSAYEMCRTADGAADAFISSGDHLWDFAAGIGIIREAGGLVCDWRGRPWRRDSSFILAGRPAVVHNLVDRIGDLQPY